jgi:N-acetylglucosamine malate deacetylase 2
VDSLRPLLGRTLVLVAHPDDEAVGCGALLQRMNDPIVVFATDGAPRSDYFWKRYGSRETYAQLRAREAEQALASLGVTHVHFLSEAAPIVDQELFQHLRLAYEELTQLIEAEIPQAILSHAYEGGHPDHDSCSFLAYHAARQFGIPVWEMPLYHRAGGDVHRQTFIDEKRQSVIEVTSQELARKQAACAVYESQAPVLQDFTAAVERFRPMARYDFARAPHAGVLNYEAWQWPIRGADLCRAFQNFLHHTSELAREREWGTVA